MKTVFFTVCLFATSMMAPVYSEENLTILQDAIHAAKMELTTPIRIQAHAVIEIKKMDEDQATRLLRDDPGFRPAALQEIEITEESSGDGFYRHFTKLRIENGRLNENGSILNDKNRIFTQEDLKFILPDKSVRRTRLIEDGKERTPSWWIRPRMNLEAPTYEHESYLPLFNLYDAFQSNGVDSVAGALNQLKPHADELFIVQENAQENFIFFAVKNPLIAGLNNVEYKIRLDSPSSLISQAVYQNDGKLFSYKHVEYDDKGFPSSIEFHQLGANCPLSINAESERNTIQEFANSSIYIEIESFELNAEFPADYWNPMPLIENGQKVRDEISGIMTSGKAGGLFM